MIRYKLIKAQLTGTIHPQQTESQSFTQKDLNEALKKRFGSIAPAVLSEAVRIVNEELADCTQSEAIYVQYGDIKILNQHTNTNITLD